MKTYSIVPIVVPGSDFFSRSPLCPFSQHAGRARGQEKKQYVLVLYKTPAHKCFYLHTVGSAV